VIQRECNEKKFKQRKNKKKIYNKKEKKKDTHILEMEGTAADVDVVKMLAY